MAVGKDILYLKGNQNAEVKHREITLGDIASVECSNSGILSRVKTIRLLTFQKEEARRCVVSVLKVIEAIHQIYPGLEVVNLGPPDLIVTYEPEERKNRLFYWLKVMGVCAVTFVGAAFSIMAFDNDVNVTKLFEQVYQLVTGLEKSGFTILEAAYCIGVFLGILIFFHHFGKCRFSVDPTPIEVEMRLYENDIQTTIIQSCDREGEELDVG